MKPYQPVYDPQAADKAMRKDAARYRRLRAMCCSDTGPSDALARAWMTGDEAAADEAIDAAMNGANA